MEPRVDQTELFFGLVYRWFEFEKNQFLSSIWSKKLSFRAERTVASCPKLIRRPFETVVTIARSPS